MGVVLLVLLVAVTTGLLVLLYKKLFMDFRFAKDVPVVQPIMPLLGHVPYFLSVSTDETFKKVVRFFSSVDRMAQFRLAHKMFLMVNHPDVLQQLLTRTVLCDKPFFYDFIHLGRGLISQKSGAVWKPIRRMLNPAFNIRVLTGYLPLMDECAENLAKQLEPLADGTTDIDVLTHTSQSTLELIFRTTMDCKIEKRTGCQEYLHRLQYIMHALGKRVLNVRHHLDIIFQMTNSYRECMKCLHWCNSFTDKIIAEKPCESESFENSHIFLEQLRSIKLEDGRGLSDEDIRNHIYTMIVAGHETTALTVSNTCLFLALYPECQEKVVAEIRQAFPDRSLKVNSDNLKQLEYLECAIKESLRLIPVAPMIARQSADSFELDGVRFPAGQIILINFYSLHRRKDLWGETAEQFDPERFHPEQAKDRHPFAFLPFSGGLRNCIGSKFAMNSLKIVLLRILQDFEIRTKLRHEDLRFKFNLTLKLNGPHVIQLVKRDLYSENAGLANI